MSRVSRPIFSASNSNVPNAMPDAMLMHTSYRIAPSGPIGAGHGIVRLWCVTREGHSVLCEVHGFKHYFYMEMPTTVALADFAHEFKRQLYGRLVSSNNKNNRRPIVMTDGHPVHNIEIVHRQSLMGYSGTEKIRFLKITLESPAYMYASRDIIEKELHYRTYEANISYTMRYTNDCGISCCQWLKFSESVRIVEQSRRLSSCSIEISANWNDVIPLDKTTVDDIAPVRIMSFDIECCKIGTGFPTAELDPISQIACVTEAYGQGYVDSIVFSLVPYGTVGASRASAGVHTPLPNASIRVQTYEDESEMLLAFAKYWRKVDPDIITGYNIDTFDLPYCFTRAETIGCKRFPYSLSRELNIKSYLKKATFQSKAFGATEDYAMKVEGRFSFDMLKYIRRNLKLRSYGLNAVSFELLGETKVEMDYKLIPAYQNGTDEQRAHLCYYCWKDAVLCLKLMTKQMAFVNGVEQSRITGVPMDFLLSRGAQIKTMSNLLQFATQKGYIIPTTTDAENHLKTKGAKVLEPKRGFYQWPVCTLDFASLYPHIMIWKNLCYTTKISRRAAVEKYGLGSDDFNVPVNSAGDGGGVDHVFVKPHVKQGILPDILTGLLAARAKAKLDLKNETDPARKAVLDGRQLGLKIVANSVYGFVKANMVCDKDIMSAVTGFGRWMLEQTERIVTEHYGFKVVYGDTDSVMVYMEGLTNDAAFEVGTRIANECTQFFGRPHKLEREKIFNPFLLIGKKRYAGKKYLGPTSQPTLAISGLESARRDNAKIGSETMAICLRIILMDGLPQRAIEFARTQIQLLLTGKMDMSKLIITKGLSKTRKQYDDSVSIQGHAELAKRIEKRAHITGESTPTTGDRIRYVMTDGTKHHKAFELVEDPQFVMTNNIPINYTYYIEKQMMKPLCRIFTPILAPTEITFKRNKKGEKKEKTLKEWQALTAYKTLFTGKHTLKLSRGSFTASQSSFGIAKFTTKVGTPCDICRALIPIPAGDGNNSSIICPSCMPQKNTRLLQLIDIEDLAQQTYAAAWTRCQRCVGSMHTAVVCSNLDCDNFFHREIARKELQQVTDKIKLISL
jgi:DNA polymerase delta subunit 1